MKHPVHTWFIYLCTLSALFFIYAFATLAGERFQPEPQQFVPPPVSQPAIAVPNENSVQMPAATPSSPVTFTGDIMLARSVELWMNAEGVDYPFRFMSDIISSSTVVFANFESSIPSHHQRTPDNVTRFSVNQKYIAALAASGVTHVSLANNHALDYGQLALAYTKEVMARNHIVSFGNPLAATTSSITYVTQGSTTIGVLALHTLFVAPERETLRTLLTEMSQKSDIQIVYIHWGTEYKSTHDAAQETLARELVELGADAIVGHHPHVTQDIQLIDGVPVFYSLGNFIFDQYFSTAVQTGLVVQLSVTAPTLTWRLIPVSSLTSRSQPHQMNPAQTLDFLATLADKSESSLIESIKAGIIISTSSIAKAAENSMIYR